MAPSGSRRRIVADGKAVSQAVGSQFDQPPIGPDLLVEHGRRIEGAQGWIQLPRHRFDPGVDLRVAARTKLAGHFGGNFGAAEPAIGRVGHLHGVASAAHNRGR
jgi:hypothetical protein